MPNSVVSRCGKARFTVLTPAIVRMEWCPYGVFENRGSLTFIQREQGLPLLAFLWRLSDLALSLNCFVFPWGPPRRFCRQAWCRVRVVRQRA